MASGARSTLATSLGVLGAWALAFALGTSLLGLINYRRLATEFENGARSLHRVVSQRADQHDAHLTALAAVLGPPEPSIQSARAVAEAVRRFYPRVSGIDIVWSGSAPEILFTTREQALSAAAVDALNARVNGLTVGRTALISAPAQGRYTLVKRLASDSDGAPLGAALEVDAARLVEAEDPLRVDTAVRLISSTAEILQDSGVREPPALFPPFFFEKPLGSRSQPLTLQLVSRPALGEIFQPGPLFVVALLAAISVAAGFCVIVARRSARNAERQALLLRHEAKLAQVMRVDALGEMGAGIAHELTQPLTAILSGAQAGLRVLRGSGAYPAEVETVLEANVRHARRAGDILGRLRAYADGRPPITEFADLNHLVRDVAELVTRDLQARNVALTLDFEERSPPVVLVDPVSVQQIVHNLVRNAAEALCSSQNARRNVTISIRAWGGQAAISVADEGPGVPPPDLARLFDPFFTTKPDGMGLGLPLCERLAAAFGGRIEGANRVEGGAIFTLWLPLAPFPAKAPRPAA